MKPITLYDQNHARVGETWHRRARQLVRSGRAAWLAEGKSAMLLPDAEATHPPRNERSECFPRGAIKQEDTMENIETTANEAANVSETQPDALLEQARQNVQERQTLFKRILLYAVAWPVWGLVYWEWLDRLIRYAWMHNLYAHSAANTVRNFLREMPPSAQWEMQAVLRTLERISDAHIPILWYVSMGAMAVWTVWLARQVYTYAKRHWHFRVSSPKSRQSALEREYNRLKRKAEEETEG